MFIGERKIAKVVEVETDANTPYDVVELSFKGGEAPVKMAKHLYEAISHKNQGRGSVTDAVNHFFSSKFLLELAGAGLEYYMAENVAAAMRTLAHNSREVLFSKTFNCSGGDSMSLTAVMDAATAKE